jgi:hypothetical protein
MSMRRLGEQLGWSESKVSRIELAQHQLSETDLSSVLAILGVTGAEREKLLRLARDMNQPAWWELGLDLSPQVTALLGAEQRATRITQFSLVMLPGLLQTRSYSRALFDSFRIPRAQIDRYIEMCQLRQGILHREDAVRYESYIDESALRRPIGGPGVMTEQLEQMLRMAEASNVEIRAIPTAVGAYTGLLGAFVLVDFVRDCSIVHLEQRRATGVLDDPDDVEVFVQAADDLREIALSERDSRHLIENYVRQYGEQKSPK